MNWEQAAKSYTDYLRIERGLSKNAIDSYSLDVKKLKKYLVSHHLTVSPVKIDKDTVLQCVYEASKNLSARSQSRLISGLKSFFSYLIFEKYREDNPMDLVETPRIGRKLPPTLSTEEIDMLIGAINRSSLEGQRNVAIIETLYGCGLRVSELIGLKISDLFFKEGFIKVLGKGNKERFVPVNPQTEKFLAVFPSRELSFNDTKIRYFPLSVSAADLPFEQMTTIQFDGQTAFDIYQNEIKNLIEQA